jgi:hypothetical protein
MSNIQHKTDEKEKPIKFKEIKQSLENAFVEVYKKIKYGGVAGVNKYYELLNDKFESIVKYAIENNDVNLVKQIHDCEQYICDTRALSVIYIFIEYVLSYSYANKYTEKHPGVVQKILNIKGYIGYQYEFAVKTNDLKYIATIFNHFNNHYLGSRNGNQIIPINDIYKNINILTALTANYFLGTIVPCLTHFCNDPTKIYQLFTIIDNSPHKHLVTPQPMYIFMRYKYGFIKKHEIPSLVDVFRKACEVGDLEIIKTLVLNVTNVFNSLQFAMSHKNYHICIYLARTFGYKIRPNTSQHILNYYVAGGKLTDMYLSKASSILHDIAKHSIDTYDEVIKNTLQQYIPDINILKKISCYSYKILKR